VSPLTHFSLSHFTAAGGGDEETLVLPAVVDFAVEGEETAFGAPKNEVILALTLGFLESLVGGWRLCV